jgi:hypothetical protein
MIGLEFNFKRASQIEHITGKKSDLLISICKALEADTYLSPMGSKKYLKSDTKFLENDIDLKFHHYTNPIYPQLYGKFIPFLSTVDLLMNIGNEALELIVSGRKTLSA